MLQFQVHGSVCYILFFLQKDKGGIFLDGFVHILSTVIELSTDTLIFFAAWLYFLVRPLGRVFIRIFWKDFAFSYIIPGSMQQACFFTGRCISQKACIFILAISSVDLLGVGWKVIFSSLVFAYVISMVGILPFGFFRSFSPFIKVFWNIHWLEHLLYFSEGPHLKVPTFNMRFLFPYIRNGVEKNIF